MDRKGMMGEVIEEPLGTANLRQGGQFLLKRSFIQHTGII
jgi:hypothetical protein